MKVRIQERQRQIILAAMSAAILLGAPVLAQADQGKWWTPSHGGRSRAVHGPARVWGHASHGHTWGRPVHRDYVVVRPGHRGHWHRAHRVYASPYYYRHVVYVRPVRFYFGANVRVGGVTIHATNYPYHGYGYAYGCNFCDARFGTYDSYAGHVAHCDTRPAGYRIHASDWSDEDFEAEQQIRYVDER